MRSPGGCSAVCCATSPTSRPSRAATRSRPGCLPGSTPAITQGCAWQNWCFAPTSVEHAAGTVAVNGFLIDMPQLFQDFVTVALREALEGAYGGRLAAEPLHHLDEAGRVRLYPDIVWHIGGAPVAVIDAKYKAEKPRGYPNADLYQLLAYCTVLGLRTGHLVYARGNEESTRHVVRGAGVEIVCHALELDQSPDAILAEVRGLAVAIGDSRASTTELY